MIQWGNAKYRVCWLYDRWREKVYRHFSSLPFEMGFSETARTWGNAIASFPSDGRQPHSSNVSEYARMARTGKALSRSEKQARPKQYRRRASETFESSQQTFLRRRFQDESSDDGPTSSTQPIWILDEHIRLCQ